MVTNSIYLQGVFTRRIDIRSIKIIFECGSRDCLDAIEMKRYYRPQHIYSFECNPESISVCKENIKNYPGITLVEKAVYNENKIVDFYPTDMQRSIDKNIGASSLLWHHDNKVEFFQKKIQVEAIRLDTFMQEHKISHIDLLCMDLQGAEQFAIEGLGNRIKDVRYIISEVLRESAYEGDMLKGDFKQLMSKKGFRSIFYHSGNILFERI